MDDSEDWHHRETYLYALMHSKMQRSVCVCVCVLCCVVPIEVVEVGVVNSLYDGRLEGEVIVGLEGVDVNDECAVVELVDTHPRCCGIHDGLGRGIAGELLLMNLLQFLQVHHMLQLIFPCGSGCGLLLLCCGCDGGARGRSGGWGSIVSLHEGVEAGVVGTDRGGEDRR